MRIEIETEHGTSPAARAQLLFRVCRACGAAAPQRPNGSYLCLKCDPTVSHADLEAYHCTPEERAVIEAVTESEFIRFLRGDVLDGYKEGATALGAIDALLAAKTGREKG